jgi:phytoene dehydrogenase-like protein
VLVLEQHYVPGGWCHSFTLGGYRFSPGVHYLGEMGEGGRFRQIFEGLGLAQDLELLELNPDGYDHVIVADRGLRVDIPKGRERLVERLCERFPAEARGIRQLMDTVDRLGREAGEAHKLARFPGILAAPFRAPTLFRHGFRSTKSFLGSFVSDPGLQAVLAAPTAGDVGLPPSLMPAVLHAGVATHYFEGGWYPRGGGFAIPRAFVRALKRAGGELRLSTSVERILVDGRPGKLRARGVRLASGEEIAAETVISNADPHATFRLIGDEHLTGRLKRRLARTRYSVSALSLFLAVDMDLAARGFDSGNYWYMGSPDLDHIYGLGMTTQAAEIDDVPGFFLTVTTLKDRTKGHGHPGHHTMELFWFVSRDSFRAFADSAYGSRPDGYRELKERLKQVMLRAAERLIPGLQKHVVFADVGTPLTNEHYVRATRGNLYGIEKTRSQIGPFSYPIRTEVEGLRMCGASTISHGVMGAAISGLLAAGGILGCSPKALLKPNGQRLRTYLADDPSGWPEEMRRRLAGASGSEGVGGGADPAGAASDALDESLAEYATAEPVHAA